jgi:hypothetical protein
MDFIDLEKAYERVLREVMWWILKKKWVLLKYIKLIKDMYNEAVINVRTSGDIPWCIFFADDIVLVDETRCRVN